MTPETQNVERKRSWRDDYLAWICGCANAQGGILEIGKDDEGEIVGVRNVLSLLEDIPSKVRSLLGIVVEVNLRSASGLEYIEIVVEPHSNPISFRGKFHYRSGSTKQVLEGAALTRFLLEKHGRTWDDVALPGVKLSELDGRAFEGFRQRGVKSERLPPAQVFFRTGMIEAWGRGIRQIAERCREAGNPSPTWTREPDGVLCLRFPFSEAYLAAAGGGSGSADQGTTPKTSPKTSPKASPKTSPQATRSTEPMTAEARILAMLRTEPGISQPVIAERLGTSVRAVKYHFRKLREAGAIRRVGSSRAGHWEVLDGDSPRPGRIPELDPPDA